MCEHAGVCRRLISPDALTMKQPQFLLYAPEIARRECIDTGLHRGRRIVMHRRHANPHRRRENLHGTGDMIVQPDSGQVIEKAFGGGRARINAKLILSRDGQGHRWQMRAGEIGKQCRLIERITHG